MYEGVEVIGCDAGSQDDDSIGKQGVIVWVGCRSWGSLMCNKREDCGQVGLSVSVEKSRLCGKLHIYDAGVDGHEPDKRVLLFTGRVCV